MELRLISVLTGISAKSGKRYTRITVRGKREDGWSSLAEFWLKEDVASRMFADGIQEDDTINISLSLDSETSKPFISSVEKVEV